MYSVPYHTFQPKILLSSAHSRDDCCCTFILTLSHEPLLTCVELEQNWIVEDTPPLNFKFVTSQSSRISRNKMFIHIPQFYPSTCLFYPSFISITMSILKFFREHLESTERALAECTYVHRMPYFLLDF